MYFPKYNLVANHFNCILLLSHFTMCRLTHSILITHSYCPILSLLTFHLVFTPFLSISLHVCVCMSVRVCVPFMLAGKKILYQVTSFYVKTETWPFLYIVFSKITKRLKIAAVVNTIDKNLLRSCLVMAEVKWLWLIKE